MFQIPLILIEFIKFQLVADKFSVRIYGIKSKFDSSCFVSNMHADITGANEVMPSFS